MNSGGSAIAGYQGAPGAFSEAAALERFGARRVRGYRTFAGVVEALLQGEISAAVLPLRNTLAGEIADVRDLLARNSGLAVAAEAEMRIELCLLGSADSTLAGVQTALSHPVALAQCTRFLSQHGLGAQSCWDTAGAVREVVRRGDPRCAAVGPARAAQRYGARVLARAIQDAAFNVTRFALIRRARDADRRSSLARLPE